MKRRLLNLLTFLSLLLCVAVVAVCVRSYWTAEAIGFVREGWAVHVVIENGRGRITRIVASDDDVWPASPLTRSTLPAAGFRQGRETGRGRSFLGFRFATDETSVSRWQAVHIPLWFLITVVGMPPAIWVLRRRSARRRRSLRLCPRCGYDVRATPERCPECGALVFVCSTG